MRKKVVLSKRDSKGAGWEGRVWHFKEVNFFTPTRPSFIEL